MSEKKEVRRGWRVVWVRQDGRMSSAIASYQPVVLEIGAWVERPTWKGKLCGPLAVFNQRSDAESFKESIRSWCPRDVFVVMECEYEPSEVTRLWQYGGYDGDECKYSDTYLPLGTVFADRIRLLPKEERT